MLKSNIKILLCLTLLFGLLLGCGGGGSDGNGKDTATLTFTCDPMTVDYNGTATLVWESTETESCESSGAWAQDTKGVSGEETVGPLTEESTFTLECSGSGGTVSKAVTVAVRPEGAPSVALSASPESPTENEDTVTISWVGNNVTSCSASEGNGAWDGTGMAASGSEDVGTLSEDTEFVINCTGPEGPASDRLTVTVRSANAPVATLTASPDLPVQGVDDVTLTWTSERADRCEARDGTDGWTGSKDPGGSENIGPLSEPTTFTIRCFGDGETFIDASVTVAVSTPGQPQLDLSATRTWARPDTPFDLVWSSEHVDEDSCTAEEAWSGSRTPNGREENVTITQDSTFVLKCTGGGVEVRDSVDVEFIAIGQGNAVLEWDPPVKPDLSPEDFDGYIFNWGTTSGDYSAERQEEVDRNDINQHTISNLESGEWFFIVRSYRVSDEHGQLISEPSNEERGMIRPAQTTFTRVR